MSAVISYSPALTMALDVTLRSLMCKDVGGTCVACYVLFPCSSHLLSVLDYGDVIHMEGLLVTC